MYIAVSVKMSNSICPEKGAKISVGVNYSISEGSESKVIRLP